MSLKIMIAVPSLFASVAIAAVTTSQPKNGEYETAYRAAYQQFVTTGNCTTIKPVKTTTERASNHGCRDAAAVVERNLRKNLKKELSK